MGDSTYVSMFNSILIALSQSDEILDFGTKLVNQLTDLLGMYSTNYPIYPKLTLFSSVNARKMDCFLPLL